MKTFWLNQIKKLSERAADNISAICLPLGIYCQLSICLKDQFTIPQLRLIKDLYQRSVDNI